MLRALRTLLLVVATSCTGGGSAPVAPPDGAPEPEPPTKLTDIPRVTFRWNPDAGDKTVSPELGGPGFTGEGWTTRTDLYALGNPDAPQGGALTTELPDWPATLRTIGKDSASTLNTFVEYRLYMPLLDLDPVTLEFIPALATHWWISEDRQTWRFRIDPEARWNDGTPVTAADVVATWKLRMDPTMLEPSDMLTFGKLHEPVAISKYIVEVKPREENWRNFLYFATALRPMPAHEIGGMSGKDFLDKYQFAYPVSNGPYLVRPEDVDMGNSLTLTRNRQWWADANPYYDGWFNLEQFRFVIVKEPQLAFEKIKKGEVDFYIVPKAQWWAEEIPKLETVKRGLLLPRKFYNDAPIGLSGLALNMKRPPLDDLRIRKALQHLYDRETMIAKLFYDEYVPYSSYHQGGPYESPKNVVYPYDEVRAVELLEEAGWKDLDAEGYRVKDGRRLGFTVTYRSPLTERSLTVFQESCKRAGIKLDLQLLSPATAWKNFQEKQFEINEQSWSGLEFPNPETSWKGELARVPNNNNNVGFENPRVDALCAQYDREYDVQRRVEIVQEIDAILYEEHPYILGWYGPAQRVLFWNRFGMPEWGVGRYHEDSRYDLPLLWWVDPEKEKQLAAAKDDATITMDAGSRENRFWDEWASVHGAVATSAADLKAP